MVVVAVVVSVVVVVLVRAQKQRRVFAQGVQLIKGGQGAIDT